MKKLFSLLLCSAIAVGALSLSVSAADTDDYYGDVYGKYGLRVGNTKVTDENKDNILSDKTVTAKYDVKTNTLTLNNLNLKPQDCEFDRAIVAMAKATEDEKLKSYIGIDCAHDINIVLLGINTIDFSSVANSGDSCGIICSARINISGEGTLNVLSPQNSISFIGIGTVYAYPEDGEIITSFIGIKDSKINIKVLKADYLSCLDSYAGKFGGSADIKLLYGASNEEGAALYIDDVDITGGELFIAGLSNNLGKSDLICKPINLEEYGPYLIKHSNDFEGKNAKKTEDIDSIDEGTFYSLRYFSLKPILKVKGVEIDNMKPQIGDTLTAVPDPAESLVTYQWNVDKKPVKGETNKTYKVKAEDIGKTVSVTVVGIENYKGTATSPETAKVLAPTLSGKFEFAKGDAPKDGLAFKFSSSVSIIKSLEVGGKTIDAQAYKLDTKNNTVTLNKTYLDKLDKGQFTLSAVILDNVKADAKFTVSDSKEKVENPKTGTSLPQGAMSLMLFAGLSLTVALKKKF